MMTGGITLIIVSGKRLSGDGLSLLIFFTNGFGKPGHPTVSEPE